MEHIKLNTIEEAIEDFKAGNFVIVVDDEDRENEGDLIIAAELITPEKVNFMLKHARGVLCAPITISRCKELDLPHQVLDNTSVLGTPPLPSALWPTRLLRQPPSDARGISIRSTLRKRACCAVPAIRRLLWIWHVWRDSIRPVL